MLRTALRQGPRAPLARTCARALSSDVGLLEQLLSQAKARDAEVAAEKAKAEAEENASGNPKFGVQTLNAISPFGLEKFPKKHFQISNTPNETHAILLRSYKLPSAEVPSTTRAIARCGAGTNNIPVPDMTERGIVVFNTPGANANSVKELVLCGMLLSARGIVEGINHTTSKIVPEEPDHKAVAARIEKDKKHFGGIELVGKTLAVCGLGNIGAMVADAALGLGMKVVGYDPKISVDSAWRLPSDVKRCETLADAFEKADFVSINMPYIKGVTHHAIDAEVMANMKPTCAILNFARAEIVDTAALLAKYNSGHTGKYICDFADPVMQNHEKFICIPHLVASTEEAEDNCAVMAAEQVLNFIETGTIKNSVNMPTTFLEVQKGNVARLCIINKNLPGSLGEITTLLGSMGLNIAQQINTSRDSIAYNVIDLENFTKESTPDDEALALQSKLMELDGVISTRLIWTGNAAEGPGYFLTKG
jgi:D-3-phosphoglycerate dehydrogenase